MRRTRWIRLLVAVCLPLGAAAQGSQPPNHRSDPQAMEDAFGALLMAGDLGDSAAVSRRLGLKLYRVARGTDTQAGAKSAHETSLLSPHFLLPGVAYDMDVGPGSRTRIKLSFISRVCPDVADLTRWATDWGLKLDTPFRERNETLQSVTGPQGLSLTLDPEKRRCVGAFTQLLPTALPLPALRIAQRSAGGDLVRKVVGLIAVGDLRDRQGVSRVLHAQIILPQPNEALLADAIRGLDASGSYFRIAEVQEPDIGLAIDTTHVCVPASAITREMRRRSIDWHTADEEGTTVLRTLRSGNLLEIIASQSGNCLESLYISQMTAYGGTL
jgi:hypothetical protein